MAAPEQEQAREPASPAAAPAAQGQGQGQGRKRWRWLKWIAVTLVLLVLVAAGLVTAALRTEWGARTGWGLATRVLDGALSGDYAGGSVAHGLDLRNVRYRDAQQTIAIDRVHGAWDFRFSPRKLTISALELGRVEVTLQPSPDKSE
ncbi:MAG: hypothetical protein EOO78_37480, partial [Oxalobacteraceae bacterium]